MASSTKKEESVVVVGWDFDDESLIKTQIEVGKEVALQATGDDVALMLQDDPCENCDSFEHRIEECPFNKDPHPQGMKARRSRVFGTCKCPECGQGFVNSARLERHLAVHQVFGSFLCPLCGKTYKYEYNLFYHWRRTCRDLNEVIDPDERKHFDINSLKQLVDQVAAKKGDMMDAHSSFRGGLEYGHPPVRTEVPAARRGEACAQCGLVVMGGHFERHMAVHDGTQGIDGRSVCGGYYCDLCGLMFRAHFNLIRHWRTGCPEIQIQLQPNTDLTMDDDTLKELVTELLNKKRVDGTTAESGLPEQEDSIRRLLHKTQNQQEVEGQESGDPSDKSAPATVAGDDAEPSLDAKSTVQKIYIQPPPTYSGMKSSWTAGAPSSAVEGRPMFSDDGDYLEDLTGYGRMSVRASGSLLGDDGEEDGGVVTADGAADRALLRPTVDPAMLAAYGTTDPNARAKWSMIGGPVQCPECFRSFANAGRLERHLSGFHTAYGTHHCILCGNRFKYDYNLLYHYRHSCPYTKAFIERDVREQMDSQSLRKLIKNLSDKEVQLNTNLQSELAQKTNTDGQLMPLRPSEMVRANPSRPRPPISTQVLTAAVAQQYLVQQRPGLPDGKTCPICNIVFYGPKGIERHMKMAHPTEYEDWQKSGGDESFLDPPKLEMNRYNEEQQMLVTEQQYLERQHLRMLRAAGGGGGGNRVEMIEQMGEDELRELEGQIVHIEDDTGVVEVQNAVYMEPQPKGGRRIIVTREPMPPSQPTPQTSRIAHSPRSPRRVAVANRQPPEEEQPQQETAVSEEQQPLQPPTDIIDPTLESSVATILSEMKDEAGKSAKSTTATRAATRSSTVMTAEFEEYLDVEGEGGADVTPTAPTTDDSDPSSAVVSVPPKKRGLRSSAVSASTTKQIPQSPPAKRTKKEVITPSKPESGGGLEREADEADEGQVIRRSTRERKPSKRL